MKDAPFHVDPAERGHLVRGIVTRTGATVEGTLLADNGADVRWISTTEGVTGVDRNSVQRVDPLDKLEKLQVLALQPGDILVATTPHGFNQEAAVRLREQLLQHVPGHQVFVIANGIELAALRTETPRPAPADKSWLQMENG